MNKMADNGTFGGIHCLSAMCLAINITLYHARYRCNCGLVSSDEGGEWNIWAERGVEGRRVGLN